MKMSDLKVGGRYKNTKCNLTNKKYVVIVKIDEHRCYFECYNSTFAIFKDNFIKWFAPDKEYNVKRILECLK